MAEFSVDHLLIQGLTRGDESAFEVLLNRYQQSIHNFAWRFLGDAESARDVAQETFLRLHQHLQSGKQIEYLSALLFRIARNCCIDLQRKNRLRSVKPDEMPIETRTADQVLDEKERRQRIDEAVGRLPDNQRMAVILRHTESMSYEEIAEVMSVSRSSVESLLFRARSRLKEMLIQ